MAGTVNEKGQPRVSDRVHVVIRCDDKNLLSNSVPLHRPVLTQTLLYSRVFAIAALWLGFS